MKQLVKRIRYLIPPAKIPSEAVEEWQRSVEGKDRNQIAMEEETLS